MRIFVPRETRIPLAPSAAKKLLESGVELEVEVGLGQSLGYPDDAFTQLGATLSRNREASLRTANIVFRVRPPPFAEIGLLEPGAVTFLGFLEPFSHPDLIGALARARVSAFCMELIPRTTLAQKMDALSSQASLAGYAAVIVAAERLDKALPMMSTPAGTIAPARVLVIGAGVAGLQAIATATAKRLGARVEAFDTRPAVEE